MSVAAVPHHVAIVMDGNGRWATQRLLPRIAGHKKGVDALRDCVRRCVERGVRVLSVFAFSSENWNRPADEVSGLMDLLSLAVAREVQPLAAAGVRLCFAGDRSVLGERLQAALAQAEAQTAHHQRLTLNICFNYGGRWDIAQAARALAQRGEAITEASLSRQLSLAHVPDPDLVIRTGGEMRLSNFMLWQSAYTELYFSDRLWPEFGPADLDAALAEFAQRERRFGRVAPDAGGPARADPVEHEPPRQKVA